MRLYKQGAPRAERMTVHTIRWRTRRERALPRPINYVPRAAADVDGVRVEQVSRHA